MNVQFCIGEALCGIALGVALNELRHNKQEKQELIKEVERLRELLKRN